MNREEWNLSQIHEIEEPSAELMVLASDLTDLVKEAVRLGLPEATARRRNINWLTAFVECNVNERSRREHMRGVANARQGQIARQNFGA